MKKVLLMLLCLTLALPVFGAMGEGALTDGSYESSAQGMDGTVSISVTIEGGAITAIEVLDDNETAGVGDRAV